MHLTVRPIGLFNWRGFVTLFNKESKRFASVAMQSIVAPVITTLLYYAVFNLAFDGQRPGPGGIPFIQFLIPGLIMLAMAQNAFANTSSSLVLGKLQGSIVDQLMPPIGAAELASAWVLGGLFRGMCIGLVSLPALALIGPVPHHAPLVAILFGALGSMMLSSIGVLAGIWADKFDQIATVNNFIILPLTFLSGTFYSIASLPKFFATLAQFNPFFHMIDGMRYGFTGVHDGNLWFGAGCLVMVNAILATACYLVLKSGWKLKS